MQLGRILALKEPPGTGFFSPAKNTVSKKTAKETAKKPLKKPGFPFRFFLTLKKLLKQTAYQIQLTHFLSGETISGYFQCRLQEMQIRITTRRKVRRQKTIRESGVTFGEHVLEVYF